VSEADEFSNDFRDERDARFTGLSFTRDAQDEACGWRRRHRNALPTSC
jgi:hypothetical protein